MAVKAKAPQRASLRGLFLSVPLVSWLAAGRGAARRGRSGGRRGRLGLSGSRGRRSTRPESEPRAAGPRQRPRGRSRRGRGRIAGLVRALSDRSRGRRLLLQLVGVILLLRRDRVVEVESREDPVRILDQLAVVLPELLPLRRRAVDDRSRSCPACRPS